MAGDGDEAFPVHRAMMASSSDYFKAMFTGGSTKYLALEPAGFAIIMNFYQQEGHGFACWLGQMAFQCGA